MAGSGAVTAMNDDQDFLILTRYLKQFSPDVEGRATESPPPDIAARLDRFTSGGVDASERSNLALLLKDHPEWVRYLAGKIKQRG